MKKSAKMGFTLVELLVTIILLGVIGAIVVYNMMNVSTNSKENEYDKFIAKIKSAAEAYASINPDVFKDLYVNKAYLYIKMEDLINDGKIDEKLVNPYTDERIKPNELIKANLSTTNGALTFEYPVKNNDKENFLVALSDYVVNGEPYDCMQGAGTYQLALSEENGDLIMLNNQETIEKYNFKCEYPSEFETYGDEYPTSYRNGKYTTKAGTYDITYSWITESGIKKSSKRTLRVLSKVIPTFSIKEVVNGTSTIYNYDFNASPYYTPSYTTQNGWKYLTYTPLVEGSDPETTVYTVKKVALNQFSENETTADGAKEELVVANSNDFSVAYPVDDGIKRYSIDSTVRGHYNKEYFYNTSNSVVIKSKLIIPDPFVKLDGSNWSTDRTVTIKNGIHSPVGIAYYEYSLSDPNTKDNQKVESLYTFNDKYSSSASIKVPLLSNNRINNDASKYLSILEGNSCIDTKTEYLKIYVRAINDDGYIGDWKEVNVNLTSDLQKLVLQDSHCHKTSSNSCYYTDKNAYIEYAGHRFVILENYGNGRVLVTSAEQGRYVTPINVKWGRIEIASCDMMVYASITYRSPIIQNIIDGVNMGIRDIDKHAIFNNWPVTSMYVATYRGNSRFGTTTKYTVKTSSYPYSSYYGNATAAHVSRYGRAMATGDLYWTTDMFNKPRYTYAYGLDGSHGTGTTCYNVYLHYVDEYGRVGADEKYKGRYVGDTLRVKPMILFQNLNICATTGTDGNKTYKVALNEAN